ncbi:MAG TPA: hypothetical protein ENN90_12615 [Mariniphaga anaerophila]|uniref:EamA domain-containing protein n=1 Tax=Mariniphaga anaerophila TaxID=1484053 RepID=A0A831LT37_9BACT|nr:hypothetical protein [Mariniphaga anaerophila]
MIFLAASIVSSTAIYVIFKWAGYFSCRLKTLIAVNYLTAAILGFGFFLRFNPAPFFTNNQWIPFAIALGILYIVMFFLIGASSQKAGVTVNTLANKLSLVFPVFFSLYWFNEPVSVWKIAGLITAVAAVLLTLYKKNIRSTNFLWFILPLAIFVGSGFTDSFIKFIQGTQISGGQTAAFSTFVFFVSFVCGAVAVAFRGKKDRKIAHLPTLLLGLLLGMANFGSLYFIISALNLSQIDSSLVFALNNMLIVALSATAGFVIFKEKMNRINVAGLIMAFISLYILL